MYLRHAYLLLFRHAFLLDRLQDGSFFVCARAFTVRRHLDRITTASVQVGRGVFRKWHQRRCRLVHTW